MSIKKCVLVIRIGRLGDTVLATPVIEVLQQALGLKVKIDFVASPGASTAVLELDPRINEVFPVDRRRLPWRLHPMKKRLRKHSRSTPYDLVINLECGKECDDFLEFIECREFCGRPLIQPRHIPGRHCVDTEKTIYADRLGPAITAAADPRLEAGREAEFQPLPGGEGHVVLNPGFSGIQKNDYRSHRSWPLQHWAELIGLIRQRLGLAVAINGTEEERRVLEPLLALPGVQSLLGSSLQTLIPALANARCLVSVDTGTMHLATALGTPTVALFGPTIPELTGPYSKKTPFSVLKSGISCQPCFRTAEEKQCKINRCMQELKPEEVYSCMAGLAPA
jgi:ADP-heptose:LPS heptosyltransferase